MHNCGNPDCGTEFAKYSKEELKHLNSLKEFAFMSTSKDKYIQAIILLSDAMGFLKKNEPDMYHKANIHNTGRVWDEIAEVSMFLQQLMKENN